MGAPEDADPGDPRAWRACLPGIGHTVTEDAVRAEFEPMDLAEFRRAYLAQWPDEMPADEWTVTGRDDWAALLDPIAIPADPVAFAVDVPPERRFGSIVAAGSCPRSGHLVLDLVEHRQPASRW